MVPPVALGLLEVAPDAVLGVTADGRVVLANPAAERLFGRTQPELRGRPLTDLLPDGLAAVDGASAGRLDAARARCGDGREIRVDIGVSALDAEMGPVTLAVVRDATERLEIERALRESRAELERSNARLNEAQRCARQGSWEWDIAANVVTWSDELYRIYGYAPGAIEPTYERFLEHVHEEDRESVDARNRKAFGDHQPFEDIKRVFRADGHEFLMRTHGEVVVDEDGNPIRMVGVCEDVTDAVRAEEARRRLAAVVESANDAIYTLGTDWRFTSWNPAAERLYGWTAEEVVGQPIDLILPDAQRTTEHARERALVAGRRVEPFEARRRRRDGTLIDVSVTMSALRDPDGRVTEISAIARDISERLRTERQLEYLADHDPLTGLYNRRRFEEELASACARATRHAEPGALLLLDLDNFKVVNDTLGHHAGDELLCGVAGVLASRVRETDAVARFGGDEFAVLLPHTGLEEAHVLAEDLLRLVREHAMGIGGQTVHTTASIGVVAFGTDPEENAEDLLADADRAMYAAKDTGRDRVTAHTPHERTAARARSRVGWERQIADALKDDRFVLHAQPILDLATGLQDRYELVVRMVLGDELVSPGSFLSVAERSGQIHAIDRWVVRRAVELLEAAPGVTLEVNLSGCTTDDGEMPAYIASLLETHAVDPASLVFEITETAAIGTMSRARDLADALGALGCRFALDDFGAGFSSFYYLKRLPVDYLKIDGDFIRSPRSETDELIIESIVRIARALGKETIAEYVGDEETVARLRELGVDHAQGFHIGAPIPAEEALGIPQSTKVRCLTPPRTVDRTSRAS